MAALTPIGVVEKNMWSDTPQSVLAVRDGFQVPRIRAVPNTAQVIQLQTWRNRTAEVLVGHEMTGTLATRLHCDLAVARRVGAACPQPAIVLVQDDLGDEPVHDGHFGSRTRGASRD